MAEFLTMDEAKSKFGTKGRTNAGLTLGIIGTALAAFAGNNGGCGCGNGGGILGNLFGGNNNCCAMQAAENAKTLAMAQGQQADNLSWANRVQSMQDDIDLYTYVNSRALATNERIGNESQVLTNQIWKGRVEDLQEKSAMYVDIVSRDNAQNLRLCDELYKRREQDVQEKADLFARLSTRISDLEKKEAATAAALPLMFELNKVNAERYTDACCCKSETITTLTPTVTKVIDVIIPNGVSIVSQQVLDELPTSLPVKGHCAYSVFDVRVTPAPAPTAAIASVAKSK